MPVFMPCAADRTVDVRGVAEQERAALLEMVGDAVVDMVASKTSSPARAGCAAARPCGG